MFGNFRVMALVILKKIADSATLQTLRNYKEYCNEQIALCDKYIISEYSNK